MNIVRIVAILGAVLTFLTCSGRAGIVISEIHYHPVEEETFNIDGTPVLYLTNDVHEFVEFQNTGTSPVDLSGWVVAGGISYTFPTNTLIAPGAFRVIARNPARLAAVYSLPVADVLGPYAGFLGNSSDTIRLRDAAGNAVDSLTYESTFPWAQSADALGAQDRFTGLLATNYQYKGRSLQRVSVTWPSGDPANWLASPLTGPTPGAAQAVTRTIPKPVVVAFSAVQTTDGASVIRSNNAVTVNCTFSATNSLGNVTLEYFLDNINATNETRISVAMADLSVGKYSASIPGQTNRSIVRYRFKADRGDGLETVSPRADDPQIAPIGAGGAREAWHGYFVTPVRTSSNAIYDVLIPTTSLSQMANNITMNPRRVTAATATGLPRDVPYVAATAPQWNGTQPAFFACDGVLWDIQIRYHGSLFHRAPSNPSYKVHFPSHKPFNGQSSWFETVHGIEFREAQRLNRLLGLPSSKMRVVDWYLNSNAQTNHTEQGEYAGEMLDDYHDLQQQLNPGSIKEETGEIYKDVGNRDFSQNSTEGPYTRGDSAPLAANAGWSQLQRYAWTYTLQNNYWKGSKPIRDLIEGMWAARGDTPVTHNFSTIPTSLSSARAWFTNNWDIETTITSMALLEWMSIWDDAAQNHFFWRRANGKWSRLGWDYDGVMSVGTVGAPGGPMGGTTNQTIYGGEFGALTVFDGVNWWKDTFYKCFRTEYTRRLWELNNSFCDPTNLTAQGFVRAATFAKSRQAYVNTQLGSFGTYYKPARPSNVYPPTGLSIAGTTNLVLSAYTHPQSAAHYGTLWEIRLATGDYETPVVRELSTNSKTAYPIPFDQLTYGQTYFWRATHIDTNGHASVVSAETGFSWGVAPASAGGLVLNEVLAFNRRAVQNGDAFPDYVEIRNNSATNIPLAGYTLTDDPLLPAKYAFPAGTILIPGAYLLVWCDKDTASPGLHSGFGLNEEGETVLLMNGGAIVDSVSFGPQAPDISIGRIINGTGGWQANTPTPLTANSARVLGSVNSLRLNEWMADPAYGNDWLELFNSDSNVVALGGLYLSDTPIFPTISKIPALSFVEPGGFVRFWADGSIAGGSHLNFKLSKTGETISLTAANGTTSIDTLTFSAQTTDVSQGRLPDGGSEIVSFSSGTASPGYFNWVPAPVVINEVLANSVAPFEDAVELANPTAAPVNIGGWWLSDDLGNRKKYQIPAGTIIPAGGYKVFYAAQLSQGAGGFELNAKGDEVILSAVDAAGGLSGISSLARFGTSAENTSLGRVPGTGLNASSGGVEFWPQTAHTFGQDNPPDVVAFRSGAGAANGSPRIGPITINEIMYHPPDVGTNDNSRDEFVELHNISTNSIDLAGWRLKGDTEFIIPAGTTISPGGYLLLVGFDPADAATLAAFGTNYVIPAGTPVRGPFTQKLANGTFSVEIAYPTIVGGFTRYINVDKVEYRDLPPWPTTPDGTGTSLQRASDMMIGNTAANWTGNTPTPGAVNLGIITNLTIMTPSLLTGGIQGQTYSNLLTAVGGAAPLSWRISSNSVPGMTLSADGVLSGIPAFVGTNSFWVEVSDSGGTIDRRLFSLIVGTTAPRITTPGSLPDGGLGSTYLLSLAIVGGTAPYQWEVSSGTLPPGLSLNGAGILSGTPTTSGTWTFSIRAVDYANLSASAPFTLSIPAIPLAITSPSPMVSGQQGLPYSQALTALGGVAPYSWSIDTGLLPPGLSLSSVGDITGIPTLTGIYSFTAVAMDASSRSVTKTLSIAIDLPTFTIITDALPDSTVGRSYSQTLAAQGGTAPYSWSVVWGGLPPGLSLLADGTVTGVFTTGGTFSYIVEATDHGNVRAHKLFTTTIQNNPPLIVSQGSGTGSPRFLIYGDAGAVYSIEGSANLLDWETLWTTNPPALPFSWSDPTTPVQPVRFYRASVVP